MHGVNLTPDDLAAAAKCPLFQGCADDEMIRFFTHCGVNVFSAVTGMPSASMSGVPSDFFMSVPFMVYSLPGVSPI